MGNCVMFLCSLIGGFGDEPSVEHGLHQHLCDHCPIFHSRFVCFQASLSVIACSSSGIEEGADYD